MKAIHNNILLWLFLSALFPASITAEPQLVLTAYEEQIIRQAGIDREIAAIVKNESGTQLHRLSGYDENGYQVMANGVTISVPASRSETLLSSLRTQLSNRGYMAFLVESNEAIKTDRIGIIKGTDQYEILRIMHTNGDDDDIAYEDVVAKLKEWERKWPFSIIGAENGWVEIEFKILPQDLKTFVQDVYDFCPDIVDEGAGTVADLIKEIQSTKRLLLWWE